ncbi:MAG: efflux RND transporter periplasmic adaptor subunit, partial [Planctomycetaceae bacterium]|nr:efflux RND transporter periplasmic adaptor subunit [Planctomycetaceae bacterium]
APAEEGKEPLHAAGFLRAEAHLQLAVRRAGLVLSVERLEGDEVGPGEPVVLLDDAEERIQVALARNDVETAEINLAKIRSGPRPEDLERAKAFLAESQAGLDLAERTLRADIELQKGGILSDLSRRRSERMLDAAKAQAEGRRLDLVLLEKGSRPEDVRLAEVEVERQRSRLAQRELEAARARIAGSREGRAVVTRVWVEEGQWVEAGRVVAELVYMDRLRVELDLPGESVEGLARGAKAAIRSPRHPGAELSGAVTRVSPVLDAASGTIRIVVEADNPGHRFRPGGEAEVEIRR